MNRLKSLIVTFGVYIFTLVVGYFVYSTLIDTYSLLFTVLISDIVMTIVIFTVSLLYNNSSVYDPYWSIIPFFIVFLWIVDIGYFNLNSYLILMGVFIWGFRLTLNWILDFKGFNEEDFRYVDFRKTFGKYYWIISFLGIHLFPTLIVLLGLYPIYYVLSNEMVNEVFVYIGFSIMILSAVISYFSDNQLRDHKLYNRTESIKIGIWKYSRHPNYLSELIFWFGSFVTSLSIGFDFISSLGIIGMIVLFNFYSIPKMESKLLKSKVDYEDVVNTVPRLLPFTFKKK